MSAAKIYFSARSIYTPLGLGLQANWENMSQGKIGIQLLEREDITLKSFYGSAFPDHHQFLLNTNQDFSFLTKIERLMIATITDVEKKIPVPFSDKSTVFILSTTKGNIDEIAKKPDPKRLGISDLGQTITSWFGNPNLPVIISNACISGVSALIMAKNLVEQGEYEQAVVCGADILSEFTVSGFSSLNAISPFPCTPFDKNRSGLSPGEGCGVIVLSKNKPERKNAVYISGAATSNDANHISGPSRTGEGLHLAIEKAIKLARINKQDISYINAHGTATIYNDESESLAITLSGLENVALHSLKGYLGHTFGAAGLIECALAAECMERNQLLGSVGYKEHGVSVPLNISNSNMPLATAHTLKTASGFGGCNAALILSADE